MKKVFVAIAMLFLLNAVAAAVINEKSVLESGYDEFVVQGTDQNACLQMAVAKDLNQNSAGYYTIFSLHAEFLPVISEDAKASVFLNNDENALETAIATDFENGWYRFLLPREKLKEQNTLKVCLQTSNTVTVVRMFSDSLIGTYKMPEFKAELFTKTTDNDSPLIGEDFEVTIKLTNSGSEATDVNILYMKPELNTEYTQILRGQTSYFNIIRPGETVTLKYALKARKAGPMALLGAVAYYSNIFGEKKRVVSNYPLVEIRVPEVKVKALVLLKDAVKNTGEPASARIAVKNEADNPLYNIAVHLQLPDGVTLNSGVMNETIESLKPKETKYLDFNFSSVTASDYLLGCKLVYLDYNVTETSCEQAKITFEDKKIPAEIIFAIAIVAFALLVYAYFHFKK